MDHEYRERVCKRSTQRRHSVVSTHDEEPDSQKMLAQELRGLEHDGLLTRTIYDEMPRAWIAASQHGAAASSGAG